MSTQVLELFVHFVIPGIFMSGEKGGPVEGFDVDRAASLAASEASDPAQHSADADSKKSTKGKPNKPARRASKSKKSNRAQDMKLVERIRAGDANAYAQLVQRYESRIVALLVGMVRNREDAQDLAQQAFIKAYRNLDRFRGTASFYTWLYRIAFNLAIDFKRRAKNKPGVEFDEGRLHTEGGVLPDPRHGSDSPDRELERSRLRALLRNAIDELPKDQRAVVVLREVEGLSYKEISEVVDCPEGTVMSRLFYARKKLQELLLATREEGV